jgi:hypothetical protein
MINPHSIHHRLRIRCNLKWAVLRLHFSSLLLVALLVLLAWLTCLLTPNLTSTTTRQICFPPLLVSTVGTCRGSRIAYAAEIRIIFFIQLVQHRSFTLRIIQRDRSLFVLSFVICSTPAADQ